MAVRFRRSIKIAPGVKLNLNKKSVGVTVGTKGAHYSVNSKGTRTTTVGIPGTGLSYVDSKKIGTKASLSDEDSIVPDLPNYTDLTDNSTSITPPKKSKKKLIAGIIIALILIGTLLNLGSGKVESITANWPKTSFDINETAKVNITVDPEDADISDIAISDNNIAKMEYSNGIATISFCGEGTEHIYFTCSDVKSNGRTIKVVDKEAEAQRQKAAEEAAKEQERLAAERKAQEAAEQQAQQQQSQQQTQQQVTAPPAQTQMVWIPNSGSKYHSNPSCSNMKNPQQVTLDYAQSAGYEPCKKCH